MRLQGADNKIVRYIRYFAVYMLLLTSNGFYIYAQGFHIPLMLCAAGLYFVLSQWKLDLKLLIMVMILVTIVSISGLTNDETIRNVVVPLTDFLGAALIADGAIIGMGAVVTKNVGLMRFGLVFLPEKSGRVLTKVL